MSTMRDDIKRGLNDIWPAAVAAAPIGLLFGAVAASKGLSPFEVFLMSIMVFAGGAQFAAIELWASPAPVAALVFSTLPINARHVLMGASLRPSSRASAAGRNSSASTTWPTRTGPWPRSAPARIA